jgi:hypothetical protein
MKVLGQYPFKEIVIEMRLFPDNCQAVVLYQGVKVAQTVGYMTCREAYETIMEFCSDRTWYEDRLLAGKIQIADKVSADMAVLATLKM